MFMQYSAGSSSNELNRTTLYKQKQYSLSCANCDSSRDKQACVQLHRCLASKFQAGARIETQHGSPRILTSCSDEEQANYQKSSFGTYIC